MRTAMFKCVAQSRCARRTLQSLFHYYNNVMVVFDAATLSGLVGSKLQNCQIQVQTFTNNAVYILPTAPQAQSTRSNSVPSVPLWRIVFLETSADLYRWPFRQFNAIDVGILQIITFVGLPEFTRRAFIQYSALMQYPHPVCEFINISQYV